MSIQAFMKELSQTSGWVQGKCLEDKASSNWQLNIAIVPERENLNKAASCLAPIFYQFKLKFKNFVFNRPEKSTIDSNHWDGTVLGLDGFPYLDIEKDRRGKECCIDIDVDDDVNDGEGGYRYTPEEWKQIMLEAWQALLKAKVKLEHRIPLTDHSDEIGFSDHTFLVSPFSYSIKSNSESNHPLKHISFTLKDLDDYDINLGEILKMQQTSILTQEEHLKKLNLSIDERMGRIKDLKLPIIDRLQALSIAKKNDNPPLMLSLNELAELDWIIHHLPRQIENKKLCFAPIADKWREGLRDPLAHSLMAELLVDSEKLDELIHEIETGISVIKDKFQEIDSDGYDNKKEIKISQLRIEGKIDKDPASMQLVLKSRMFAQHERRMNERDSNQFIAARDPEADIFQPLIWAIAILNPAIPTQKKLQAELMTLHHDLFDQAQAIGLAVPQQTQKREDIKSVSRAVELMIERLINSTASKKDKLKSIYTCEQAVNCLPSFREPTWKKIGKAVAAVLIAATGAALGFVIGAAIEGAILAAMSTPVGGSAGILGIIHGGFQGIITGWTVGSMVGAALGLSGGAYLAKRGLFSQKTIFTQTLNEAEVIAKSRAFASS